MVALGFFLAMESLALLQSMQCRYQTTLHMFTDYVIDLYITFRIHYVRCQMMEAFFVAHFLAGAPGNVDALEQTVEAGVDEVSIVHSLNLLRQALVNNQLSEEQSRHLRMLSLSTRTQTVGLWDCGTQTPSYGPAGQGTARQLPSNPYTSPVEQGPSRDVVREVPVQTEPPTARRSVITGSSSGGHPHYPCPGSSCNSSQSW